MTTFIPTYLRPISQTHTGNQSLVDMKADDVESISCTHIENLSFKQIDPIKIWVNKQAYQGRREVTSDREIRVDKNVDTPERHWWIISKGLFETLEPPLRSHPDLFDFLIALNLCIEDPVYFSQSPGQTVGGAYTYHSGAIRYRNDLSLGNIGIALLGMNEIPERITVSGDVMTVFNQVRKYRSKKIETDEEIDIRLSLHMYEDALSTTMWTVISNLYFVCENVLASGFDTDVQLIAENTSLGIEETQTWHEVVNRIKHPDKGEDVEGLLEQEENNIPSPRRMRKAANMALKQTMAELEN